MANYVLTVKLDPSQLNAQLKNIQNAFGSGGGGAGGGGGLKGALGKLQNALNGIQQSKSGGLNKAASFGFMALGIMELVKLVKGLFSMVVDSSPMLKAMMGLLNNSIMFILRPIGDFIGFMLRPILMVFLRYIALPFYKHFYPIMQKYGNTIGEGLASFLTVAIGFFQDPAGSLKKAFDGLPSTVRSIIDVVFPISGLVDLLTHITEVSKAFQDFTALISNSVIKTLQGTWKTISDTFGSISSTISSVITPAWNIIKGFWTSVSGNITSFVTPAWKAISGFFTTVSSVIGGTLNSAWTTITVVFKQIASIVKLTIQPVWTTLNNVFDWIGSTIDTDIKGVWNTISGMGKAVYNAIASIVNAFLNMPGVGAIAGAAGIKKWKMMANGGIINEPVVGVGQRSGHGYMLGEAGAEQVTPVGRGGGSGAIHIHFHAPIYGVTDLKKTILEVIQESSIRRRKI